MMTPNMPTVVGITGRKGSGKDTAARGLTIENYTLVKMAGPLKKMLEALLVYRGVDLTTINRMLEGDLKEVPHSALEGKTPRFAMQTLGTEWGRMLMGDDIWVNCMRDRTHVVGKAVISDVRFPNEAAAVKSLGGIMLRIQRDGLEHGEHSTHVSETEIDGLEVDKVVLNNGTEAELRIETRHAVVERK